MSSYMPGDETKYTVLSQLNYSAGKPVSIVLFFYVYAIFVSLMLFLFNLSFTSQFRKFLFFRNTGNELVHIRL